MNTTLTAPLINIVETYRIGRGQNLWHPDLLYLDLIWIWLEWN